MTDGTFQPDAKSQELLAAGVAPSAVETFQADRAATAAKDAEAAAAAAGYRPATPDEAEAFKNGYVPAPTPEPFQAVLTPAQRQAATQIITEKRAAQRQAPPPGWKEADPLDVYTDDQLLEDKTFNVEDYFRKNQVAVESDPKKTARMIELTRKAKQRSMQWGTLAKGGLKAAGEILASPFGLVTYAAKAAGGEAGPPTAGETIPRMLTNLGRTVLTGLEQPAITAYDIGATVSEEARTAGGLIPDVMPAAGQSVAENLREQSQREATEALAGTVADVAGLATTAKGIGGKLGRLLHITKSWDEMSPQEVLANLRAGAADKQALEELSKGETVALQPTLTELEARGTPIRPEEVARAQEGGLASWLTYGKLFEGIHAGSAAAKKFLANTEAAKLADGLVEARGAYTTAEKRALGFATAENAQALRQAEQAVQAAEEAVAKSQTASTLAALQSAKAGLADLAQRATAGTVETVGKALQLPEKILHKIPGVNIGTTAGTIAGMFTGGLAGGAKVVAARLTAAGAAKVGQAVEAVGAAAAPGVSRTIAQSRAADFAKAFNDSVGKALGPGGLGLDVATALATTPEGETPTDIPVFMGTLRLFKGLPVAMRRVVGGELVGERPLTETVPTDPAYGSSPVLDRAHTEAMKLAGPDVQNRVNFLRALGRKLGAQLYFLDPKDAPATIVEAAKQNGVTITPEQAAEYAAQNAVFTTTLRDRDGNPQKIVFAFGEPGMAHDVGHAIQAVLPESVNKSLDALTRSQYEGPELEAFAQRYLSRLMPELTPDQLANWRDYFNKDTLPKHISDAETYMLRELSAENIANSFGSRAEQAGQKPDLYRTIAFGIAGLAERLGVNLLGQTELGLGLESSARVQRANEIALADILRSPERAAIVEVEARRAAAGKRPPTAPREERAITRAVEQATDTPPPVDAVVPAAEAQNARQITEIIADTIRKGGGMLKAWYRTAPGTTDADLSSAAPVSEVKARKAAIEAARAIPESERPLWERLFFAYGLSPSSRGPQVKTWNPLVFAANAVRWAKALQAAGAVAESPYPIVNGELTPDGWRQLRNDLQIASRNYLAGYGASGIEPGAAIGAEVFKQQIEAGGYRVPEKTTPSPEQLPQDRADVINYLMAPDTTPKTARVAAGPQIPMNVIGQKVSEATIPGRVSAIPGAPVYTGEAARAKGVEGIAVAETNPFRAKMRQLGVKPELFSVLQRLNVEHLAKVEAAPEQPVVAGNILTLAGGLSPKARTELIGGQFSPSNRDDIPVIRAAAVRDKTTGKTYPGFMHVMAYDRVFDNGPIDGVAGIEDYKAPNYGAVMDRFEEGFLVKDPGAEGFRFVDRIEAGRIAEAAGQGQANPRHGELMSEDVAGLNMGALGGVQASPAGEAVRDLATMTREEFERGPRSLQGRFGSGASGWAAERGASATSQSDAAIFRSTYEALRMAAHEAMTVKDADLAMDYITRAQTAREAYEVATGEMIDGKAGEPGALREVRKYEPEFQPPLGEVVRAAAKPAEALPIEPVREPSEAKVLTEAKTSPATSSFGKRLEEEGFEFRVTGQKGVRTVEVWKDGEQVGELQSAQNKDAKTAYIGNIKTVEKSSTGESMRRRGIAEAMYRELANTLQDDGVTQIEGMAVHPSIPGLRERVFGGSQIETGEGVGISPEEAAAYIEEKRKNPAEAFYAEIKNAIRPKAEGQYSPTSKKGKELEKEGFDFVTSSKGGEFFVKATKDGKLVGEIIVTPSELDKTRARVSAVDVVKDYQGRGIGEVLYREAANALQDDGIRLLSGMVVAPQPLGIRERVFGDTGIRNIMGEGMTVPEAQEMIRAEERAGQPTFVDVENLIRPKAEGQYAPKEKKEHPELFGGYHVGKGGYAQGEGMLRDNILDALSTWQEKGTLDQLKKHLEKVSGTKEQAQWTGLNQWLDKRKAEGKTTVTKGEVEDFIVANQVKLEELTLTEGERPSWSDGDNETDWGGTLPYWELYRGDTGESYGTVYAEVANKGALEKAYEEGTEMPEPDIYYAAYSGGGSRIGGKFQTPEMAQQAVEDRYTPEPGEGEAQYAKWTLPGGWDYREILVRLPDFPVPPEHEANVAAFEDYRAKMVAKYGSIQEFNNKATAEESQEWRDLRSRTTTPGYESPHFDDSKNNENLIAHMRVKTRKTLDGQTLFFVEEIQSDLHQEGAKSGYQSELMSAQQREFLTRKHDWLNTVLARRQDLDPKSFEEFGVDPNISEKDAQNLQLDIIDELNADTDKQKDAVPDAPFKGASWKKLLMKRAIIAAAEEGADALGWTTGEMQRERYSLAKWIGSITYHKNPDGTYSAEFWKKPIEGSGEMHGGLAHGVMNMSLKDIAALAGEDIAKQMEAGEGKEAPYASTAELLKRGPAVEVFNKGEHSWFLRYADGSEGGVWINETDAKNAMTKNNEVIDNYKLNPRRELTPENFSLGGKGKLNLYDREMVNIANDLGKKYGAKVEMKLVPVPGKDAQAVWTLPVTPALRKTAREVGFGQFSPKEQREPNKQGFFSAAKRALEDKMPNRASAQQVRAILSPNNGVKPDELKWTGLDDFLKEAENAKKPIEKADVLKFMDENAVQLEERWKATRETGQAALPPSVYPETGPRWQRYKQPGGKFYRELVWTWENPRGRASRRPFRHQQHWGPYRNPLAHARMTDRFVKGARTLFIEELQSDLHQKGRHFGYYSAAEAKTSHETSAALQEQLGAMRRQIDNIQTELNTARYELFGSTDKWLDATADPKYQEISANIAAMKAQPRVLPIEDPAATGLRDEIQRLENLRSKFLQTKAEQSGGEEKKSLKPEEVDKLTKLEKALAVAEEEYDKKYVEYHQSGVVSRRLESRPPEAPFSKSWREVFFRRLVNYAARMGYDAVSWTTGAQQAAMYEHGLRAAVDKIRWEPQKIRITSEGETIENPEGAVQVTASKNGVVRFQHTFNRDGTPIEPISGAEEDATLLDVVGESLAKKIQSEESGKVEGEHLAVGAKWMQEVYDVILPEYARKFGKKFGAKVEILPHGASTTFRRALLRPGVPREHPGLFEPTDIIEPRTTRPVRRPPNFTAWSMNITPEMRKSVVETGTPQFSPKAQAGEFKIEPVKTAWGEFPNAVMHTSVVALQKHPDYPAAKAGDPEAAIRVTKALVKPDRAAALAANFPDAQLLPVRADEAKGRNALPSALAVVLSSMTGLGIAPGIVQASRAHHTGASDVQRVERRAEFAGPVEEGGKYILVDDVSTSGSTLAALRSFIRRNGGEVVGVTVMGAAHRPDRGHGSHVALRDETLAELKKLDSARLGAILQRYGIESVEDLSNGEARIILREARKAH